MKEKYVYVYACLLSLALCCCAACKQDARYVEFEIAPEKTAILKMARSGRTELKFAGRIVEIPRIERDCEPVTIIEHEDSLYIVMADTRSANWKTYRYVFYKQSESGVREISASEFPRSMAIKNVWAPGTGKGYDAKGKLLVDHLAVESARDIDSAQFRRSETAWLWCHLETGKSYEWLMNNVFMDPVILKKYVDQYNPIRWELKEMRRVSQAEAGF